VSVPAPSSQAIHRQCHRRERYYRRGARGSDARIGHHDRFRGGGEDSR
jgi:hypothetical protein